ncbi:MAG TPA: hypothetical protein VE954_26830 [Oligoflexus sp.]|uniref:hypothetical protein n=1 Tax=Oligoflexus sp. TaxID=1971216 RepID=UPI002D43AA64|nr:hypothetical protein [Oligoflexus sp.]HYX36739.1 hypothetical protein [Oligoflexus sp.]
MEASDTDISGWQLRATEDGIQILDSILWLDARFTRDLSFLSSACCLSGRTEARVISTEETVKLLAINNIKLNALICPYNQIVSLGQLRMELLPSGAGLGAASLWVEQRQGTLLYAPQLQPQKTGITRLMQLKHADTLVLGARHPFPAHHHPSRKKEKDRLLQALQQCMAQGEYPIILCEPYAVAQEICRFLAEHGIEPAVHKSIYRINQIYGMYGSDLGAYSLLHKRLREKKVLILPLSTYSKPIDRKPLPDGPIFCVEESLQQTSWPDLRRPVAERFFISSSGDGRELKSIIQSVSPREVFVSGPYAKQYAEELSTQKLPIHALYPSHLPTLF